jgi:hypothetical protein
MDAAFVGNNAVIGGTFDTQYSADGGNSFDVSKGDKLVGQNCETIKGLKDDKFFGITGGDIRGGNGVAISTDGGQSVKFYNISVAQTIARYGAFPSRKVWYVSAGQFPSNQNKDATLVREVSNRVHLHRDPKTKKLHAKLQRVDESKAIAPPNDDWAGELLKTEDGGATWTSQYYTTDFYLTVLTARTRLTAVLAERATRALLLVRAFGARRMARPGHRPTSRPERCTACSG